MDETDIVNVRLGQPAEVTIDAIPKKIFKAVVTEIGNNAIVRSTGVSTSQQTSASQEAKDFKVVVTLQDPPENLRPGLSATAEDHDRHAQRRPDHSDSGSDGPLAGGFESQQRRKRLSPGRCAVRPRHPTRPARDKEEVQGVFVIRDRKAEFLPVQTGITGTTDIEVLSGLKPGDEIVTGSYKVLRTLRPGASVKVDNTAPKKEDES